MRILQKAIPALIIFTLVLGIGCETQDSDTVTEPPEYTQASELSQAKPYRVTGEGNVACDLPDRKVGLWFIVSEEATSFEAYAQTAIQAVRDLYRLYGRDRTSVLLVPDDKLRGMYYAQASYAADGKGALCMTGSAPAVEMYWKVRAADRQFTVQELAIAELWSEKIPDFPSKDPWSSLSYDEDALRHYVADTLNISYDEVSLTQIDYREYEYDERF